MGVAWQSSRGLNLSAVLAQRIGSNPGALASGNDQDGSRVRQRLWLSARFTV